MQHGAKVSQKILCVCLTRNAIEEPCFCTGFHGHFHSQHIKTQQEMS